MKIYKETEIFRSAYVTKLDSGEMLLVYDGWAVDLKGQRYRPVFEETQDEYDDLVHLGWAKVKEERKTTS